MADAIAPRRRPRASTCSSRPAPAPASRWPTSCPSLLVDGPVVVSTATLALQSQLVDHDLPRLADAVEPLLGRRPTFAVLKGRHHYVCLARIGGSTAEEPDGLFDTGGGRPDQWLGEAGRLGKQVQRLRDWADGDRDRRPRRARPGRRRHGLAAGLDAGPGVRRRAARCPFGEECFAEASRARAREADIVVTNHSLLAVDMLAGRHIVPPHRLLVIDEAHELADRVSSAAQAELTPELVDRAARRARPLVDAEVVDRAHRGRRRADRRAGRRASRADSPPACRGRCAEALHPARRGHPAPLSTRSARSRPTTPTRSASSRPRPTLGDLIHTAQRLLDGADARRGLGGARRPRPPGVVVAPLSVAGPSRAHLFDDRTVVATSATPGAGRPVRHGRPLPRPGGRCPRRRPAPPPPPPAAEARDARRRARRTDPRRAPDLAGELARRRLPVRLPRQGILYVAAHLPRPSHVRAVRRRPAEELVDAGQRARRPYPRASSRPGGPPSGRPRCCARRPT